jgi:hypothetical protein
MKLMRCFAGLILIAVVLASTSSIAEQPVGKQLTETEINKAIIGNTIYYMGVKGKDISVFYNENGTIYAEIARDYVKNSGSWEISEGGKLCVKWIRPNWGNGCRTLFLDETTGQIRMYNKEGSMTIHTLKIRPGNPENLGPSQKF